MNISKTVKLDKFITDEELLREYIKNSIAYLVVCKKIGYIPSKTILEDLYKTASYDYKKYPSCNFDYKNFFFSYICNGAPIAYPKYHTISETAVEYWYTFKRNILEIYYQVFNKVDFKNIELATKQGKIAKRIAKYCFKTFQTDVTKYVERIGYTIRGHYLKDCELTIKIDQEFDTIGNKQSNDDYSCIFSSDGFNRYQYYRLFASNAHLVRIYRNDQLIGRALLFNSYDSYNTENDYYHNLVLVNGYGRDIISGTSVDNHTIDCIAPYVSLVLDKLYKTVRVKVTETFWVNQNRGIVFYPKTEEFLEEEIFINVVCDSNEYRCYECDGFYNSNETDPIELTSGDLVCQVCYDEMYKTCDLCGIVVSDSEIHFLNGNSVCDECYANFDQCTICQEIIKTEEGTYHSDRFICNNCLESLECSICGKETTEGLLKSEFFLCEECIEKAMEKTKESRALLTSRFYSSLSYRNISVYQEIMGHNES